MIFTKVQDFKFSRHYKREFRIGETGIKFTAIPILETENA